MADTGAGGIGGAGGTGVLCDVDENNRIDEAEVGLFDDAAGTAEENRGLVCPVNDEDFFRFTTSGPNKLLDVRAQLTDLRPIRLNVEILGPEGVCTYNPAQLCTAGAQCVANTGDVCELDRGRCRPGGQILPCSGGRGCAGGTACVLTQSSIGSATEPVNSGSIHVARGNVPAIDAGEYILKVSSTTVAESEEEYALVVREIDEPDANEPNNYAHQTSDLDLQATPTAAVDGYLSYEGDDDWFRVLHAVATEPVVTVTLSWPNGADYEPTFFLCAPTCNIVAPDAQSDGPAAQQRRLRTLLPIGTDFSIKVEQRQGGLGVGFDIDTPYSLEVTVEPDPAELSGRNDTIDTALSMPLGTPAAPAAPISRNDTIVAPGDADWYVLERAGATPAGTQSLINVLATAADPVDAGYVMQMAFFRACASPGMDCCVPGAPPGPGDTCVPPVLRDSGTLVGLWYQWPFGESLITGSGGEGSLELGGASPNYLEVQLPMFENVLYMRIDHIRQNVIEDPTTGGTLPGHSPPGVVCSTGNEVGCYRLRVQHLAEPDLGEATDSDSRFVGRPLRIRPDGEPFYEQGDFFDHSRGLDDNYWAVVTGAAGASFAMLNTGISIAAGACGQVSLRAYTGRGVPGGSATVTLNPTAGAFYSDGTCTTPQNTVAPNPGTSIGTTFFMAPAAGDVTVTTALAGGGTTTGSIQVFAAAGTPGPAIALSATPPAGFTVNGTSGPVSVSLSTAPAAPVVVTLEVFSSAPADVGCGQFGNGNCPGGIDNAPGLSPACAGTMVGGVTRCQVQLPAGQQDLEIILNTEAPGPVTLAVTAPGYSPLYTSFGTSNPQTFTLTQAAGGTALTGFLYAGDNDFFSVDVSGFGDSVGMTVRVTMGATPLDMRVTAFRGDGGVGAEVGTNDVCDSSGNGCGGGSCSVRHFCDHGSINEEVGVGNGQCAWVQGGGDMLIWVNDYLFNEWDSDTPYTVEVEMSEGCPSTCNSYICSGGQ